MFILSSCSHSGTNKLISDNITAYIDTIPINVYEVDNNIRQELYDELNRIYIIRKIALEDVIKNKLLLLEATKYKITIDKLLDSLYQHGINSKRFQKYIIDNRYYNGIPVFERTLKYYDINLVHGHEVLIKRFKEYLLMNYVDSLKVIYKARILLQPPISPNIKFDDLMVHYRGDLKSKVTLTVISDFECEMCRKYNAIFDSIYLKYGNKVRFGYTNFGSYVSVSALAAESAARQGKFWEMHDSIFSSSTLPDTSDILRIAKNMNLNIGEFKSDFNDKGLQTIVEKNLYIIKNAGIYATPTIMINNKPIFNSSSVNEIEKMLKDNLSQIN
jgi:protein-disulfide isomerase